MEIEIYTLDTNFVRTGTVVEDYESFIWTERFNVLGDFQLTMRSTPANRKRFAIGTYLNHSETHRIMVVDSIEDIVDEQGRATLKFTGNSIESIFKSRLARNVLSDLTTDPKWIITGLPAAIARQIVYDICIVPVLDAGDEVPLFEETPGWMFPEDTIAEPADSVVYEIEPQDLYTALTTITGIYDMGFRIYREWEFGSPLTFGVYMGVDRTSGQSLYPAVVFSPALDNMESTTEFSTASQYKNVAYVISPVGSEIVYAPGVASSISSYERRVLFVRADDIQDVVPADATARMIQRGLEELAKHRSFAGFDGELNQNSAYRYGGSPSLDPFEEGIKIYNLGDLVELQSATGSRSIMQVTEQIFVSDVQGQRGYPTLTSKTLITPGSWDSVAASIAWDDVDPGLFWDDAEEV